MNPAHDPAQWAQLFAYWQQHGDWHGELFETRLNALNSAMIAAPPGTFDVNAFLAELLEPKSSASPDVAQDAKRPPLAAPAPAPVDLPLAPAIGPPDASSPIDTPSVSIISLPLSVPTPASTAATTPALPTPAAANHHHRGTCTPQPHAKPARPPATPTHSSPLREPAAAGSLKRRRAPESDESLPPAKKSNVQVAVPVNGGVAATATPVAGPSVERAQYSHWHKLAGAVATGSRVTGSSMFQAPSATPAPFPHGSSSTHPHHAYGMPSSAVATAAGPSHGAPQPLRAPPDKGPAHMRPAKGTGVRTSKPAPFSNELYCDICHQNREPKAVWYTQRGLTQHQRHAHPEIARH